MVNTITFGGVTSSTYDIYISGEGVWSAPARDAEMVTIPGRNGAFVHDKERFENIEVTYPAFIVKDNNTNFATKIDGFRNAMCAQVGYQKLTDTFHTDEYRMAALVDGMEIKPILYNDHAATFDITFNCKPQRFLTTGDTAVTVANNGTITNPTLFDAKPLLAVKGYGTLTMNGYPIELNNTTLGDIKLADAQNGKTSVTFDNSLLNGGDPIFLASAKHNVWSTDFNKIASSASLGTPTVTASNATCGTYTCGYMTKSSGDKSRVAVTYDLRDITFTAGTSGSYKVSVSATITFTDSTTTTKTYAYTVAYNGTNTISFTETYDGATATASSTIGETRATSSVSALGNPSYIDCDLGEAYKIVNSELVSLDNAVELGAELPVLSSGSNSVTYDNTITEVKITPRWWKI